MSDLVGYSFYTVHFLRPCPLVSAVMYQLSVMKEREGGREGGRERGREKEIIKRNRGHVA